MCAVDVCGPPRNVACRFPLEMRRGAIGGVVAIGRGVGVAKGRRIFVGTLDPEDGAIVFVDIGLQIRSQIDELNVFGDEQFFLVRCGMNQFLIEADTTHIFSFQTGLAGTHPLVTACSPEQPTVHAAVAGDGRVRVYDVRTARKGPPEWESVPSGLAGWATGPILSFVGPHGIAMGFTTSWGRAVDVSFWDTRMEQAPTSRCVSGMSSVRPCLAFTKDDVVVMYTPNAVGVADDFFHSAARFDATCLAPPPKPRVMGAVDLEEENKNDAHFLAALYVGGMVFAVGAGTVYTFPVGRGLPFEGPSPPDAPPVPVAAATDEVLGKHERASKDEDEDEDEEPSSKH